jgi:glycosyltransferase involved in cell wall biosynthesis
VDQEEEETFDDSVPSHIHIHKLQFSGFNDITSWKKLWLLLKEIKPDIVWSHLYFSNTIFRVLKPFVGYKVITVEHNTYIHKTLVQKLIDWFLSFFTYRIVTVSQYVAQFTAKQERISRKKFVAILNGVDGTFYRTKAQATDVRQVRNSLGFKEQDKVIISVGQLIKQKNHILLIETFAEFVKTHPEYKLIILGEGAMRGELERCISSHGLQGVVKLLGIQKDTPQFYAISDFFVLPSLFEGFALVCIEAMACGLPVLTTRVAGPDKYISEAVDGFFFKPTVVGLLKGLDTIANMSEEAMVEMRRRAKEKASQYDILSAVNNYEKLFREALK